MNMYRFSNTVSSIALVSAIMLGLSAQAAADQVFPDDVIVQGSLCAGFDCVNNESFGFDTLRLKENNLRIHFDDTSNSSSFPAVDWRIVINDSANGGASYFAIEDSSAGRTPFRVLAGAPTSSLYVASNGNVGMGTSSPATQLHVVDGNTPTMRLEQDGSSGFTAQTWDIAGNEANFFIRDVTNGSRLPFRIEPSTPANTMYLASTGNVGLGTAAPAYALHVQRNNGTASMMIEDTTSTAGPRGLLLLRNNGQTSLTIEDTSVSAGSNTGREWNIQNQSGALIMTTAPGGPGETEFLIDAGGNLTISGQLTTTGTCSVGCDRVFSEDYPLPSIREHAELMFGRGYLPNVGPTLEGSPMNVSDKVERMLNELEHAHIYIVRQQDMIDDLVDRLDAVESRG
jgi:hypothetical protein